MNVHILEDDGKPAFAVLPYAEYERLLALAEEATDAQALGEFVERYRCGEEETVPVAVVDRLLAGESPLRVWREHRHITAAQLAATVGVTPAHISKLESGKGDPSLSLLIKLAEALRVSLEELAPRA